MYKKEVTVLYDQEFDDLVHKHITMGYSCVLDNEWHNDTDHYFVDVQPDLFDEYDKKKLNWVLDNESVVYAARLLLRVLVGQGVLEPGSFLILVRW